MKHKITIQTVSTAQPIPSRSLLQHWAKTALSQQQQKTAALTIRIVDETESANLNETYRHKVGPTNILSFPFEAPPELKQAELGDIVICAPLVNEEAGQLHTSYEAHWAHLVVHGILHLLGYDHLTDPEAEVMESLEIEILKILQFPNPYEEESSLYE